MCQQDELRIVLDVVAAAAKKLFGQKLDSVLLYGSYARGDYDEQSDVDIMILADISMTDACKYSSALHEELGDLELSYDCVLSFSVVSSSLFRQYQNALPFYRDVSKEGILIAG